MCLPRFLALQATSQLVCRPPQFLKPPPLMAIEDFTQLGLSLFCRSRASSEYSLRNGIHGVRRIHLRLELLVNGLETRLLQRANASALIFIKGE
jgi:hypothetical protein